MLNPSYAYVEFRYDQKRLKSNKYAIKYQVNSVLGARYITFLSMRFQQPTSFLLLLRELVDMCGQAYLIHNIT